MKKFFGNVLTIVVGNFLTIAIFVGILGAIVMFSLAGSLFNRHGVKDASVLELTFDHPMKESSMDDEVGLFAQNETDAYFRDVLRSIQAAKDDEKIKGISLKIQSFQGGTSQLSDVRDALLDFKKSGKFIYAYSHNSDQSAYLLNSVADSIFQNPLGMVFFQGMSAEVMFFKKFGDKYGVDFQVIRHGAYKSAVEPYLREDLSPENREQLGLLLNDIWGNMSKKVADSRKLTQVQVNAYADSLVSFNPDNALKFKLVDKIAHESDYDHTIAKLINLEVGEKDKFEEKLAKHTVSLLDYSMTLKAEKGKDQVAVLYASGPISSGEGFSGIQSEVYKKAIRDLSEDENVKAVVLRVNSPGGSADAAEEILYELKKLHKKKPIIVSFGDVAASGGYYIAMESDAIFASPNTITGSIGVLGMVPSFQKMANNVGLTTDYVKTNQNSDFLKTVFQPMSETGIKAMTNMTEGVYKVFVGHVMNGRKMTFEQVDSIGGGRVWSGTQALKIGLIDRFGTLEDAIQAAAEKAKLDNYSVMSYPFRKGGFEEFLQEYQGTKAEGFIQQELGTEYFQIYQQLKQMKEYQGIQLRLPYEIKLK